MNKIFLNILLSVLHRLRSPCPDKENALKTNKFYSCLSLLTLTSILPSFHLISFISSNRSQVMVLKVTLPQLFLFPIEKSKFFVLMKHYCLVGKMWFDKSPSPYSKVQYWFAEFRD